MNNGSTRTKTTFIEEARRKQILDIALEKIDAQGFQNTTIQEIANQAGISKGVIYYHFKGKQELIGSIWTALIDELFEFRRKRVETKKTAHEKLIAYVETNFKFLKNNFNKFIALFRVGIDFGADPSRSNPWSHEGNKRCFEYLAGILTEGQKTGEFREFDPGISAPIIQAAIDGLMIQWVSTPDLYDLEACRKMLLEIIDSYTANRNRR